MTKRYLIPVVILVVAIAGLWLMNATAPGAKRAAPTDDSSPASSRPGLPANPDNAANGQSPSAGRTPADRPPLTPEMRERIKNMTPEQRQQFFAQQRASDGQASQQQNANRNNRRSGGFSGRFANFGSTSSATVSVLPASFNSWSPEHTLFGKIVSHQQREYRAKLNSQVEEIHVNTGQQVNKGDLLITLDDSEVQISLKQIRARLDNLDAQIRLHRIQSDADKKNLEIDQTLLDIAKKSVDRYQNLTNQQLTSSFDFETALKNYQNQLLTVQNRQLTIAKQEDNLKQLQAQRAELEASLDTVNQQLSDTKITATINGVVGQMPIREGDSVTANTLLAFVFDDRRLGVESRIPISWASKIRDQGANNIQSFAQLNEQQYGLQLTDLDSVVSQGSVAARFTFNGAPPVTLGRYVSLRLVLPSQEGLIAVPASSLYENRLLFRVQNNLLQEVSVAVIGQMQRDGETWFLVKGDTVTEGDPILRTRLPNAESGLRVIVAREQIPTQLDSGAEL